MKALCIKQPWAWLIVNGLKDIENRSWPLRYRGRLVIHAGLGFDKAGAEKIKARGIKLPDTFDRGGLVGIVTVTDCVEQSESPWFVGPFGFVLKDAETLPFIPWRGKLGIFDVEIPPKHTLTPS